MWGEGEGNRLGDVKVANLRFNVGKRRREKTEEKERERQNGEGSARLSSMNRSSGFIPTTGIKVGGRGNQGRSVQIVPLKTPIFAHSSNVRSIKIFLAGNRGRR